MLRQGHLAGTDQVANIKMIRCGLSSPGIVCRVASSGTDGTIDAAIIQMSRDSAGGCCTPLRYCRYEGPAKVCRAQLPMMESLLPVHPLIVIFLSRRSTAQGRTCELTRKAVGMGRLGMVMPAQRVAHLLPKGIPVPDSAQELSAQVWHFRAYGREQFRVRADKRGKRCGA